MDKTDKDKCLSNITSLIEKMYDGEGNLWDRIDKVFYAEEQAKVMGFSSKEIELAKQKGKQAFLQKTNAVFGTHL